jgi:uncharacterized damage-inducible protein DinB
MNKGLAEMFRYNAWANRALFEACRSLTEAQLDTHVPGISGSVRDLLMHIAGGQQTFILRTKGRQHEGELGRWSDWPGIETLIHIAARTSDELISIAEQLEAVLASNSSFRQHSIDHLGTVVPIDACGAPLRTER